MEKSKNPHAAIVHLSINIHELLPTGECDGKVICKKTLEEHNIKSKQLIQIKGFDLYDCIKNLKKAINNFKSETN